MATLRDASFLLDKLDIQHSPVGVYDAPVDSEFNPVVQILPQKRTCIYAYFNAWMRGQTLKLTSSNFGCLGCGYWLFGKETRTRKALVDFLTDTEGLKCTKEVTEGWLSGSDTYAPKHKTLFVGPLKGAMENYLKSVTFFVNPDQLSALLIAANYCSSETQVPPVSIPFGSGCSQLLPLVVYTEMPHAVIGATDLSMRGYLPNNLLAFTVNKPMFEQLCHLGHQSFLDKPYFSEFLQRRGGAMG